MYKQLDVITANIYRYLSEVGVNTDDVTLVVPEAVIAEASKSASYGYYIHDPFSSPTSYYNPYSGKTYNPSFIQRLNDINIKSNKQMQNDADSLRKELESLKKENEYLRSMTKDEPF